MTPDSSSATGSTRPIIQPRPLPPGLIYLANTQKELGGCHDCTLATGPEAYCALTYIVRLVIAAVHVCCSIPQFGMKFGSSGMVPLYVDALSGEILAECGNTVQFHSGRWLPFRLSIQVLSFAS